MLEAYWSSKNPSNLNHENHLQHFTTTFCGHLNHRLITLANWALPCRWRTCSKKASGSVFFQTHLKPSWSYSQTRVINSCHQFLASLNGLAMTYRTVQPSPQRSKDFNSLPSCDGTNSIKGFHIAINSLAFHSCDLQHLSEARGCNRRPLRVAWGDDLFQVLYRYN